MFSLCFEKFPVFFLSFDKISKFPVFSLTRIFFGHFPCFPCAVGTLERVVSVEKSGPGGGLFTDRVMCPVFGDHHMEAIMW